MRFALAALLALAACEPPPDDVMPMAGGADGGVVAIQQGLTFQPLAIVAGIHFKMHFTYNPIADADIATTVGGMEVYPTPYPPLAFNRHTQNQWYGYGEIQNFSPVHSVHFKVASANPNDPAAPWITWGDVVASCTFVTGNQDALLNQSVAAVDCNVDSNYPILVANNQIWIYADPGCSNGASGTEWAGEYINNLNDYRLRYDASTNWFTVSFGHQGPWGERSYWQLMSLQCMPGSSAMWQHPGPWWDPIWTILFGQVSLHDIRGPYTWN